MATLEERLVNSAENYPYGDDTTRSCGWHVRNGTVRDARKRLDSSIAYFHEALAEWAIREEYGNLQEEMAATLVKRLGGDSADKPKVAESYSYIIGTISGRGDI
jgi:hypothetical protein